MGREFGKVVGYFLNNKQDNTRKFCETKKEVNDYLKDHPNKKIKLILVIQFNGGNLDCQKIQFESIHTFPINQELIRHMLGKHNSDWRVPTNIEYRHRHHRSDT